MRIKKLKPTDPEYLLRDEKTKEVIEKKCPCELLEQGKCKQSGTLRPKADCDNCQSRDQFCKALEKVAA